MIANTTLHLTGLDETSCRDVVGAVFKDNGIDPVAP